MATATKRPTLADKHKEFKENAVRVLHEYANRADHCHSFDSFMVDIAGLPGRDGYHDPAQRWGDAPPKPEIVGERTRSKFNTWKDRVEQEAWKRADEYGLSTAFDGAMERAGFRRRPPYVYSTITTRGTVEITQCIRHREGTTPEPDRPALAREARHAILSGDVPIEVV